MAWTKTNDGGFAYNEGSLNFTLRGSAFYDSNGDGVPDGVTFENGRPVFMGIKNLRDFHFDVPRGILTVNGNEYKLVELDGNIENGEELSLLRENIGFPQGNDRTNPAAYKKVAENQFTYNEGSLNYTLTGGAFHDNNNDGIPDGVQIIGPKPFFGVDGTVFDTSKENFHFKVPSGSLIVNGERFQLADLDGDPDNGYELVVPEVQGKLGWTKIDGGFVYKRHADNNPEVMGGLKLFGKDLVDNGNGEPEGVTIPTIIIGKMINGRRITQIGIEGLHGEVFLNHPEALHSFGVKGDSNYNILITKDNGNLIETLFTNISPNSTVKINDTVVIKTDGDGDYNFTGTGKFKLNNDFITLNGGDRELKVQIKNGKIKSIDGFTDEDVVKVSKSGNIMINGKKIALAANKDMDMYGKPARTGGGDSGEDSDGDSANEDSATVTENTEELTKTKNIFEFNSSDNNEIETADFTFSIKNFADNDALTVGLVQKLFGEDNSDEIIFKPQPLDITVEKISPVEIKPETFFENITPAKNKNFGSENISIVENYESKIAEVLGDSKSFNITPCELPTEKNSRLENSETGNTLKVGEYLQNLQLEKILPEKNIGADFLENKESKFNSEIISSAQFQNSKFKFQK